MSVKLFNYKFNILSKNQIKKMYIRCSHGINKFYRKNLDRGERILTTFLDLTKAFHCVYFVIILQIKLIRVRGIPLSWIKSYVRNRIKTVQLSNKISDSWVTEGCFLNIKLSEKICNASASTFLGWKFCLWKQSSEVLVWIWRTFLLNKSTFRYNCRWLNLFCN